MKAINDFFQDVESTLRRSIRNNSKGLSIKQKIIYMNYSDVIKRMVELWKMGYPFCEVESDDLTDFAKECVAVGFFRPKGIHHDIFSIFLMEGKILDPIPSEFRETSNLIKEKLYNLGDPHLRQTYAKDVAIGIDSSLSCVFDHITDLEREGWDSRYTRRAISNFVHDAINHFKLFNIDLIPLLKQSSDFEKEYGNYDQWIDADESTEPTSKKEVVVNDISSNKLLNDIDKQINMVVPKYISVSQRPKLNGLLETNFTNGKINWEGSLNNLVNAVCYWIKIGLINLPDGCSKLDYIQNFFKHKGKEINEGSLRNAFSTTGNVT